MVKGRMGQPVRAGSRSKEDTMHPMFVKLFLDTSADDVQDEEAAKRRAVNRARLARSRMATRAAARDRDRRPRR
jgi:hypothetical protein